ncbi:MAG: HNH endonuclease [Chloroflexi bacterium]|nr:HNH endonuclease [Chloroflexota bacterium]
MSFYHQNRDSAALLRFLKNFDRLAYGLFILRMRRDPRISRYRIVLEAIEIGTEISADDDGPLALSTLEKRDIVRALDGTIYQNQTRRFTTPILARLSNAIADPPISEFNKVTVEHVLPQNPTADSEWVKAFSNPDEREEWTHRLANLVLLSHKKNSRARNFEFTRKKTEYFRRHGIPSFALTSQVIDKDEWSPALLERRQHYLLNVLKKEWRLD